MGVLFLFVWGSAAEDGYIVLKEPTRAYKNAVKAMDVPKIRELIKQNYHCNGQYDGRISCLSYAISKNNVELFKVLLYEGHADPEYRNRVHKSTPLHTATGKKTSLEFIDMLLNYGARVDSKDESDRTPLHYAVQNRNISAAKKLLDAGADVNARLYGGKRAMHIAARNCKHSNVLEMFELLLDHGADINASALSLGTPLSVVCNEYCLPKYDNEAACFLLEHGARSNNPYFKYDNLRAECRKFK
jgi:ankyrin repeat protein